MIVGNTINIVQVVKPVYLTPIKHPAWGVESSIIQILAGSKPTDISESQNVNASFKKLLLIYGGEAPLSIW